MAVSENSLAEQLKHVPSADLLALVGARDALSRATWIADANHPGRVKATFRLKGDNAGDVRAAIGEILFNNGGCGSSETADRGVVTVTFDVAPETRDRTNTLIAHTHNVAATAAAR